MFVSYSIGKYKQIGPDDFQTDYTITDNDFEEHITSKSIYDAIIDLYDNKKLNVAANIAMFFIFMLRNRHGWDMNSCLGGMKMNDRLRGKFAKYEKDVQKYLALI